MSCHHLPPQARRFTRALPLTLIGLFTLGMHSGLLAAPASNPTELSMEQRLKQAASQLKLDRQPLMDCLQHAGLSTESEEAAIQAACAAELTALQQDAISQLQAALGIVDMAPERRLVLPPQSAAGSATTTVTPAHRERLRQGIQGS